MKTAIDTVLIIKIGTSTLTKRNDNGLIELDIESFERIANQVIDLQRKGCNIAIVSSAAITAGMTITGLIDRPANTEESMPTLQGLASIGWRHILNAWDIALGEHIIGEILITKQELELESERTELLKVTHNLMSNGYIPVINENDAITHEEIAFGDNDTLAAIFASKLKRSKLFGDDVSVVILSDIDGVYKDIRDKNTLVTEIDDIDAFEHMAETVSGDLGTGGMIAKFTAARIAQKHGVDTYIANGRTKNVIQMTLDKRTGTHFSCSARSINDRE